MTRGVFLHRADSIYDDDPAVRYQFPSRYLSRASQFVDDWIIYYEPRRGPTGRGYFAIARVQRIIPDPSVATMYLALIESGTYLEFEQSVPFSDGSGPIERGLLNEAGRISGRAQAAVRPISVEDFNAILDLGLPDEPGLPRAPSEDAALVGSLVAESQLPFEEDPERRRVETFTNRVVRDRIFRKIVLRAYDCRCAITGLKFINGGGRAEVEAAHIKPVEANGPDAPNNGVALSGTVHWMFDRGLISLSDDLDVLVSRQVNDIERVWSFVNPSRRAFAPKDPLLRPHPRYLAWHRENCFKH